MLLVAAQSIHEVAVTAQYGVVTENYGTVVLVTTLTQEIAHTGTVS